MKPILSLLENLMHFEKRLRRRHLAQKYSTEPLLRSELFSRARMEPHGKTLASSHTLSAERTGGRLLARLAENERVLMEVRNLLEDAVRAKRRITPAGEWFLDNFYLIEEHIRMAKRHLPKATAGNCRVCKMVHRPGSRGYMTLPWRQSPTAMDEWIWKVSLVSLQPTKRVTDLKLGELWAIPIMLRLALIENLRRIGTRIIAGIADRGTGRLLG